MLSALIFNQTTIQLIIIIIIVMALGVLDFTAHNIFEENLKMQYCVFTYITLLSQHQRLI